MKHLFIINPVAGGMKGRISDVEQEIRTITDRLDAPYDVCMTQAPMDACRIISETVSSEDMLYVYACGGDGTLNECVNGAALRANVAVTQYPCGTGNDFLRMFGQNNIGKFRNLQSLTTGAVRPLDLIDCNGRYGINICSVGIDARVGADVHRYSSIPIIGGATGYVTALVVNVIKGVAQRLRITSGDLVVDKSVTLVCACNGRFYGGGFNPVPDAIPDDGILEFLVVDEVSRFKIAKVVGKYAKGRYRELGDIIKHIRGTNMVLESDKDLVVNVDGEIITARNVSFKVVPRGVNFIFPLDLDFFDSE